MAIIDTRRHQMFPVLTPHQVETARRFASGPARRFEPGETVFDVGQRPVPSWLVLQGAIEVVRHDGLHVGHRIMVEGVGQISGEISQLSGGAALALGRAGPAGCTAVPFDAAHLRALMIGSAEIGEILMRAFILRRVGLIQEGWAGSVLVGREREAHTVRLQGFLTRNGYPFTLLDADAPGKGRDAVERLGIHADDLPVMICPDGTVLKQPSEAEAAACLGITPELDAERLYDVAVVGAGPAGLATAVYAASEGLSVLVLEQKTMGGQAGASARIENYLGFPTGISGQALAGRAFTQAQKFGAELAIPVGVARLACAAEAPAPFRLELSNGATAQARSVVVASGARYRRLPVPELTELEGAGVSYWASPIEAKLVQGRTVALVGAGNSAGQAVVFLAPHVERLHLIVRAPGLEASMSRYLIERIAALPNVEPHFSTEVAALQGSRAEGLSGAVLRDRTNGRTRELALDHLFLFIGADPNTAWLEDCVALDPTGFVLTTGAGAAGLQTSRPGVFAIGDVRAGSTKRVAAAVGEGAAAVAQLHAWLASEAAYPSSATVNAGGGEVQTASTLQPAASARAANPSTVNL